jgi:hypothetical protein
MPYGAGVGLMDKMRINPEVIRAKKIIAELRVNNGKANELRHTARNLQTVSRLMREEIHWWRQRNLTNH